MKGYITMTTFDTFFKTAPSLLDVDVIREAWQTLTPRYRADNWELPLPPWRHRPFDATGEQAWSTVSDYLATTDSQKPFCIYLHIPFCSSKCGFCDNYSFKLGNRQQAHIQNYVDRLCAELRLWSKQGNLRQRPVSTVHMGGGTPTFLGVAGLKQIVACCRECFTITDQTEWALESTVHDLTPEMVETMHQVGYRRLHLGVQSLEDEVRLAIGRRSSAGHVIAKIEETLALGWIVSVDLICGLPQQSLNGFLDGIEHLIHKGVHGISLYELLVYPQNQKWATHHHVTHPDRHLPNYWMFLAGAYRLEGQGYRKNLFNHWATEQDQNIYFTFPTRGEDLLAVGTIADGVFGDYRYRHPQYADYMASELPSLEGVLHHNRYEKQSAPYITALLAGHGNRHFIEAYPQFIARWLRHGLIRLTPDDGFDLTPSGSWFAGNMIAELLA
jgi:coproporphyrinogen III oxidase-like Fe-S oxidoreductase